MIAVRKKVKEVDDSYDKLKVDSLKQMIQVTGQMNREIVTWILHFLKSKGVAAESKKKHVEELKASAKTPSSSFEFFINFCCGGGS